MDRGAWQSTVHRVSKSQIRLSTRAFLLLVTKSCPTIVDQSLSITNPMDCSTPAFPVLHYLLEFAQTHAHCVNDAIQPSHSLLAPFPPALNLFQHRGLFQLASSSNQLQVLEASASASVLAMNIQG